MEDLEMDDLEMDSEVTLNKRGMPARKRKKNSLYYNEDNVVCVGEFRKQIESKSKLKPVKQEPIDSENSGFEANEPEDLFINEEQSIEPEPLYDLDSFGDFSHVELPLNEKPKNKNNLKERKTKNTTGRKRYGTSNVTRTTAAYETNFSDYEESVSVPKPAFMNDQGKHSNIDAVPKSQDTVKRKPRRRNSDCLPKTSKHPTGQQSKELIGRSFQSQEYHNNMYMECEGKQRNLRGQETKKYKNRIRQERSTELQWTSTTFPKHLAIKREQSTEVSIPNDQSSYATNTAQMDKKLAQDLSIRLRNMLRLPKTHKWVLHEFFYSDIDKVLFQGENDFKQCLKTSFPGLERRKLNRSQWCKIRCLMGKPRRCSQKFFDEERDALHIMRQRIRMIQQRKVINFDQSELPNEIPLILTIGTKVTARIRKPQDGIFSGTVGAVDVSNSSYRITFDRSLIGTHSVPDFEVVSNQPPEMVTTSSFAVKISNSSYGLPGNIKLHNAFLLGESGLFPGLPKSPFPINGVLGGFPLQALIMIVRFSKMLRFKREKIFQLKEFNTEAEKLLCYSKLSSNDFREKYSRCVLKLEALNKEMDICSNGILQFCLTIPSANKINNSLTPGQTVIPEDLRNSCQKETNIFIQGFNKKKNGNAGVQNSRSLSLISSLTSLLLQLQRFSSAPEVRLPHEMKSLKDTINDIKASLAGFNLQFFQNQIEIPMNRIQAGLCVPKHHPQPLKKGALKISTFS